jgi:hypothetical protein
MLQLQFRGRRKTPSRKLLGLQTSEGGDAEKEDADLTTPGMSFAAALRRKTEEQQQRQAHQVAGPATTEPSVPAALTQQEQQETGQSVWARNVNNLSLDKMMKRVVMVVQQIMI